jgi:hypothetical protein
MHNKKYLNIIYIFIISLVILLINYQFNLIGSRFYAQDFIANDYVYAEKIRYLKDVLSNNILAVINFSEGFGKNYLYDVKYPHFILDPALYLSFFFDEFAAIQIKLIFFQFLGFIYFYKLLRSKYKNIFLNSLFSYFFIFNLTFFSHEVSLTTNIYLLIPALCYYGKNLLKNQKIKSLLFFNLLTLFILGNIDLNILFITPILILYFIDYELKNLIVKKYLILVLPLIFQVGVFVYDPVLNTLFNKNYNIASFGGINLLYFYNLCRLLLSNIHPVSFGPVSLFFFPAIFIHLLNDRDNLKKITILYIIGISLFLLPLILENLGFKSPALIRYHLFSVGLFAFLISIDSFYNSKKNKLFNLKIINYSKIFLILITALLIILFSFNQSAGFCLALIFFIISTFTIIKDKYLNNHISFLLLNVFVYIYIFVGFNGGFPVNEVRENNVYIKNEIKKISNCLKDKLNNNSLMFIVKDGSFEKYPGRNDFIMTFIESSSKVSGRTYFHWRHNDHKNSSNIYNEIGAKGTLNTNYYPASKSYLNTNFFEINKSIKNKFIATNFIIKDNEFNLKKICDNKLKLEKNEIYVAFDGKNFEDNIYLYELKSNSSNYQIKYNLSEIEINNDKNAKSIYIPINFSKNLIIKNMNPDNYRINHFKYGVNIIFNSDIKQRDIILTSKSIKLILPYIICFIFNFLFFIFFLIQKKNYTDKFNNSKKY